MTNAHFKRALFLILFISCISFGLTAANASTWTELGPKFAGRVSSIVATDANHVWVATPGGGVWKSTDGGATFVWAGNYGLGDFTAVNLALDRNDPTRMYLRTWSGVLVSTDGAAHWTRTLYSLLGDTPYPYPGHFCSSWPLCASLSQPDVIPEDPGPWAQTVFSPTQSVIVTSLPCQGLQYSTDGGNHFTQLWPFGGSPPEKNPDNCINSIAIDDSSRRVWFTTMNDLPVHVYRSSLPWTVAGPQMGMTWDLVTNGIPVTAHEAAGITWGGVSADNMMALIYTGSVNEPYLFDGTTWNPKPAPCALWGARALVSGGTGSDFYLGGVYFAYTLNSGATWTCPALPTQYVDIRAIYPSASSGRLWIGGDQNQRGQYNLMTRFTWAPGDAPTTPASLMPSGISSWQTYTVVKARVSNRLFVGVQDSGIACSDDGGANWSGPVLTETLSLMWPAAASAGTIYALGTQSDVHSTTSGNAAGLCAGIVWPLLPAGAMTAAAIGAHAMAVDPLQLTHVFVISGTSIRYSLNGGMNWQSTSLPLTTPSGHPVALTAIYVDEAGVVYTGTHDRGVYTCSDFTHYCDGSLGAGSWTPFALNTNGPWYVDAIVESNPPASPRNFWIATSSGVYRQLSGNPAWVAAYAPAFYPFSDVAVDPNCRTRVYAAVGYLGKSTRTRGGVLVSTDNGSHWTSLTAGYPLHNVPITQILVDPASSYHVYATTYGRGLWRYDWNPLPVCTP